MIKQITVYRNDEGKALEQEVQVEANGFPAFGVTPTYWLSLQVAVKSPVGQIPVSVRLQVEAANLGEAFNQIDETIKAKLESAVQAEVKRLRDQAMNGPRIQAPRA